AIRFGPAVNRVPWISLGSPGPAADRGAARPHPAAGLEESRSSLCSAALTARRISWFSGPVARAAAPFRARCTLLCPPGTGRTIGPACVAALALACPGRAGTFDWAGLRRAGALASARRRGARAPFGAALGLPCLVAAAGRRPCRPLGLGLRFEAATARDPGLLGLVGGFVLLLPFRRSRRGPGPIRPRRLALCAARSCRLGAQLRHLLGGELAVHAARERAQPDGAVADAVQPGHLEPHRLARARHLAHPAPPRHPPP